MARTAIAIFAFRRPNHLKKVLISLISQSSQHNLPVYLFLDGPRKHDDKALVEACRTVTMQFEKQMAIEIIESKSNLGLYNSLTGGITAVLGNYEKVIVLEDDIVVSKYFLDYMLDGLQCYAECQDVASIHGYLPPISRELPDTFFLRGADCWGWATWRNRWSLYRHDARAMAMEIRSRGLAGDFNLGGRVPNLRLLDDCATGHSQSWAIRWHAACFLSDCFTLHPGRSLVRNIGLDNSGEHCVPSKALETVITEARLYVVKQEIKENPLIVAAFAQQVAPASLPVRLARRCRNKIINQSRKWKFICKDTRINLTRKHLIKTIRQVIGPVYRLVIPNQLRLGGPYSSYLEAISYATGYDSPVIASKVEEATRAVLEGRGAYERDGTVFQVRPYLKINQILKNLVTPKTVIADFGGGLGGLYINSPELFPLGCRRIVIEQTSMVYTGRRITEEYDLAIDFIDSNSQAIPKLDVLVLSSVLQYLEKPWAVVEWLIQSSNPEVVILDRTAIRRGESQWHIQLNTGYYEKTVNYPIQILDSKKLLGAFSRYRVMTTWHNHFDARLPEHIGILFIRDEGGQTIYH